MILPDTVGDSIVGPTAALDTVAVLAYKLERCLCCTPLCGDSDMRVRFGVNDTTRTQRLALETPILWELQSQTPLLHLSPWWCSCAN